MVSNNSECSIALSPDFDDQGSSLLVAHYPDLINKDSENPDLSDSDSDNLDPNDPGSDNLDLVDPVVGNPDSDDDPDEVVDVRGLKVDWVCRRLG